MIDFTGIGADLTTRADAPALGAPLRSVRLEPFGQTPDGLPVDAVVLTNAQGMQVRFIGYGGAIVSIHVPDRQGALADVVLGFDSVGAYMADDRYIGTIIGRYANRIRNGQFVLDGERYDVSRNEGANHLHGGHGGFHHRWWSVERFERAAAVGATLRYRSPDGEGGFPGTVSVRVVYTLTDDGLLIVDYSATTDRATPITLTQHSYFNLAGHDAGTVLDHELTIAATRFTPVDAVLLPTGELRPVVGTPFDFTSARTIGSRLDLMDMQLRRARGYDHNFELADAATRAEVQGASFAARLRHPRSGRTLELYTTAPGLQLYTANVIREEPRGKGGHRYGVHAGVALEPQHFPDSPNQPQFPSAILRPGDEYRSRSVYRFSVSDSRS